MFNMLIMMRTNWLHSGYSDTIGQAERSAAIYARPEPRRAEREFEGFLHLPAVPPYRLAWIFHVVCLLVPCAKPNCLYSKG